MLITHTDLFRRSTSSGGCSARWSGRRSRDRAARPGRRPGDRGHCRPSADHLREAAFDIVGAAQMVLDHNRAMVMANDTARRLFGWAPPTSGGRCRISSCPTVPSSCARHLDSARLVTCVRSRSGGPLAQGDSERVFDIRLAPLLGDGVVLGTSIAYMDVTEAHRLQDQLTELQTRARAGLRGAPGDR